MFHSRTGRVAAIIALLSTTALPQTGFAASYLDSNIKAVKTSYFTSLNDVTKFPTTQTTRTLDWRKPSMELVFDLPPAERTTEIVLTLSADPLTRVTPNAPLQVQFNNGKPVPVRSNGKGFEARIPFDAALSRARHNTIRITYPAAVNSDCVTPSDGAWSIDLAASTLRMKGTAKGGNLSIADFKQMLATPYLAPKTVGLIARGPHGTDMQALAAQAISIRTADVPNFFVSPRNTDFNVIMVKRDRLFEFTSDPMILNSKGPRIFVPRKRPANLIFTADTDGEIVKMLELFATHQLPNTRRSISSLGELNLQAFLTGDMKTVKRKAYLLDLAVPTSGPASGAQNYKFNISNPTATGGELLLRLSKASNIADNSRLSVSLNGKTLGAAKLDKTRKSVAFSIQPGEMRKTSNVLTLTPDIQSNSKFSCSAPEPLDTEFLIGDGSRLILDNTAPPLTTELSNFTTTGSLFAETESYVVLPRQTRDYQAALRVLGRLAKSSGKGFAAADYTRKSDLSQDKHTLVIGPSNLAKSYLQGAPKALREALSGQSSTGDNLLQASFERSAGIDDTVVSYAAARTDSQKIGRGGIAALYGDSQGNLTGVISATPGSNFVKASRDLIQASHWDALSGGVARWTSESVIMTQIAQSDAAINKPQTSRRFEFPDLGVYALRDLDLSWPEFDTPEFNWPEFDMPQVSLPKVKWPSFKSETIDVVSDMRENQGKFLPQKSKITAPQSVQPQTDKIVKVVNVTPKLKPSLVPAKVSTAAQPSFGLRGVFDFTSQTQTANGAYAEFEHDTKAKWFATKQWVKSKISAISNAEVFDEMAQKTDRLQDRVAPAGRGIKATISDKNPGKGLIKLGDRTVSAYGLILIMAFGLVLLLMSLAKPISRLGGRH